MSRPCTEGVMRTERPKNLTVIYYTSNQIPDQFMEATRRQLDHAVDGLPVVSVSQKPMDFGLNVCVGDIGQHPYNIYKQVLAGAHAAETDFVAMAEDDALYTRQHFNEMPLEPGVFWFDHNKWAIYTWTKPHFSHKPANRRVNWMMHCERELLIEALEERFAKYPTAESFPLKLIGEPSRYEKKLGVTVREARDWKASQPSIVFTHPEATGYKYIHGKRKAHGPIQTDHLEPWGSAEEVLELWPQ